MCRRSPPIIGAEPAADAAVVDPHVRLGRERPHHVRALLVGEPAQVQLVVVAQERRPLRHGRQLGQRGQRLDERLGLAAGQRQPQLGVEHEGEHHVRPVVGPLDGRRSQYVGRSVGVDVRLAQQDGVTVAPLHVLTPVVEDREVLGGPGSTSGGTCSSTNGAASIRKPETPELQPERHDLLDLGADLRVRPVQVRLEVVEPVEVPGARPARS